MGSLVHGTTALYIDIFEPGELHEMNLAVESGNLTLYYHPSPGKRDQTVLGDGGLDCPIHKRFGKDHRKRIQIMNGADASSLHTTRNGGKA
jgi:hypothetical protein